MWSLTKTEARQAAKLGIDEAMLRDPTGAALRALADRASTTNDEARRLHTELFADVQNRIVSALYPAFLEAHLVCKAHANSDEMLPGRPSEGFVLGVAPMAAKDKAYHCFQLWLSTDDRGRERLEMPCGDPAIPPPRKFVTQFPPGTPVADYVKACKKLDLAIRALNECWSAAKDAKKFSSFALTSIGGVALKTLDRVLAPIERSPSSPPVLKRRKKDCGDGPSKVVELRFVIQDDAGGCTPFASSAVRPDGWQRIRARTSTSCTRSALLNTGAAQSMATLESSSCARP